MRAGQQFIRFFRDRRAITSSALMLIALLIGLAVLSAFNARRQALNDLGRRITAQISLRGTTLDQEIAQLRRNAQFLAQLQSVQELTHAKLNSGAGAPDEASEALWIRQLQHVFVVFASANPEFTEIQFIDATNNGRELVEVQQYQNGIVVVPPEQLQEQGSGDSFVSSIKLQPGEVYLSDFNLTKDNSNLQEPVVPTLRVVTPVLGPDGTFFGLIVDNLNANFLLNQLKADLPRRFQVYLTNSSGDYLLSPDAGKNFTIEQGVHSRWNNDFSLRSQGESRVPGLENYTSSSGIVHGMSYKIPLDSHDKRRFLVLHVMAPDAVIQTVVYTALMQMMIGLVMAFLVIGL